MKLRYSIYFFITVIFLNLAFITSIGAHNFPIDPKSSYPIQDNAGLLSSKAKDKIASIDSYLKNKNSANVVILTFDNEIIKDVGDKEFFINNYKKEKGIDENSFIIAIFPKETIIVVNNSIRPYFTELLIEGFERKINEGRENGNLDEVLLEITQKVQQRLKQHGWLSIQLYKIKDFFNDFLTHLGLTTDDTSYGEGLAYKMKHKLKDVEDALDNWYK